MSSTSEATSSSTHQGLFPGYKHVEEFGPDDEYEDEVEECYVTLDLGSVDQTLVPSSSSYRLIGLDTPTPFLQLSGTIMKGHQQTLLGTELIFKDVAEETETPSQGNVQYFTNTDRRISFREVELKPKTAASAPVPPPSRNKIKFVITVPPSADGNAAEAMDTNDPSASTSQDPRFVEKSGENLVQPGAGSSETVGISNAQPGPTPVTSEDQDMDVDR